MTTVVLILLAGFLIATIGAPAFDKHRQRRRDLRNVGGRIRVVPPPGPPRFDAGWPRDRVSPTPRRERAS